MANLTSVGITSGVPSSGTGTVSTIDNLLALGAPISNGSTATLPAYVAQPSSVVTSTMPGLVVQVSSLSPPRSVVLSSAAQVTLTSNTVVLSSNPTLAGGAVTVTSGTITLSSNPTITSVSSGAVSIIAGANTANVLAGSSAVTSTMASLVVALSSNGAGIIGTGTP